MRWPWSRSLEAAPRSYPSAQKKQTTNLFEKRDRSIKELESLETRYLQGGPVREAIDTYALFCLTNGFTLEGDEALCKEVAKKLDAFDIESSLWQAIVDSLVFGDAFQELAPGRGTMANEIVAVLPRPAKMFDIQTDERGMVTGYTQHVSRDNVIPLKVEDILHVSLFHVGGSKYGVSLIGSAKDDIDRDVKMIDGLVDSIEAHGKPRYHAKVGQPGEDVPQAILDRIAEQLKDLKTNGELVTVQDVAIEVLDSAGISNTKIYSDLTIQRMACALGVPEEALGLGRGSTEATANVRLQGFYNKIGTIQRRLERCYNQQLIDRITKRPGAVKLKFNDISPEDEIRKAEYVAKVLNADAISPIASHEWARKQLKIEEEDAA